MLTAPCAHCQENFTVEDIDKPYYQKIAVPLPTWCPRCRLMRRLAWRNERNLYKRKCDKSGRDMISNMRPSAPCPVYHTEAWHKDNWDAPILASYDFSRPFFEQWAGLSRVSPRMHKASAGNEINSEYINHAGNCKNCYFIFNSEYIEDSMYLKFCDHCRDCMDATTALNSELCYECVNIDHGYRLFFSDDCKNCRDSAFLRNCRSVSNSVFCYGLEHKEFHIFNEPHTKEEFFEKMRQIELHTASGLARAKEKWLEWSAQFPMKRQIILNSDNCTGDALYNSKNALDCYNCSELQDCRYVVNGVRVKDSYDFFAYGQVELGYEYITGFQSYNVKFSVYVMNSTDMEYCDTCYNCHSCFGCIGLKGKSYCIFNKQYTKEEYESLVPRIIKHMGGQPASARSEAELKNKQYGEFLPMELSPFLYEDSLAQDYFPVEKPAAGPPQGTFQETATLPDNINDADIKSIVATRYRCPDTGRLFRFQEKELEFYKKMQIAIPRVSFEARYRRRNQFVPFPQ